MSAVERNLNSGIIFVGQCANLCTTVSHTHTNRHTRVRMCKNIHIHHCTITCPSLLYTNKESAIKCDWETYTFCFQMESCVRIDTDRFNVQSVQTGDWCVNYESKSTPEMGHTPHVPLEIKHLCTTPLTQPGVKRQSCSPPLPNMAAVRAMHAVAEHEATNYAQDEKPLAQ